MNFPAAEPRGIRSGSFAAEPRGIKPLRNRLKFNPIYYMTSFYRKYSVLAVTFWRHNKIPVVMLLLMAIVSVAILFSAFREHAELKDFLLNLGTELFGAILIFFLIDTIVKRALKNSAIQYAEDIEARIIIENIKGIKSGHKVKILSTWTRLLSNDAFNSDFLEAVKQAHSKNCKVLILLMDPESAAAKVREADSDGIPVRQKIRKCLYQLYKFEKENNISIEVKVYNKQPPISMIRCGDTAYVSYYSIKPPFDQSEQLILGINSKIFDFFDQRFEEVWEDAILLSDYQNSSIEVYDVKTQKMYPVNKQVKYVVLNDCYHIWSEELFQTLTNHRFIDFRVKLFRGEVDQGNLLIDSIPLIKTMEEQDYINQVNIRYKEKYGASPSTIFYYLEDE